MTHINRITMPAIPFAIPPAVDDETKPTGRMILGNPSADAKRQIRSFARYDMKVMKAGTVKRGELQWVIR